MFFLLSSVIAGIAMATGVVVFPQYLREITIGILLPWSNAMAGFSYISRHLHGESKKFAYAALANTVLRLAVMLVVFTIVLVLIDVDEFVFIIALFFSYLYNSILETIYLQRLKPKT